MQASDCIKLIKANRLCLKQYRYPIPHRIEQLAVIRHKRFLERSVQLRALAVRDLATLNRRIDLLQKISAGNRQPLVRHGAAKYRQKSFVHRQQFGGKTLIHKQLRFILLCYTIHLRAGVATSLPAPKPSITATDDG
jgi:hypothetical protein